MTVKEWLRRKEEEYEVKAALKKLVTISIKVVDQMQLKVKMDTKGLNTFYVYRNNLLIKQE